jgi:hypothetical protein
MRAQFTCRRARQSAGCGWQAPRSPALAIVLAVCLAFIAAAMGRPAPAHAAPEEDLVGIVIGGQEVTTLLVLRQGGRIWLPLDEFATITKIDIVGRPAGGSAAIRTPLGETPLPRERITRHLGVVYIDSRYLKERLNFKLSPNKADGALVVKLPWIGRRPASDAEEVDRSSLEPEVSPPQFGVATLHGSTSFQFTGSGDKVYDNTFRMTGFGAGGVWQLAYEDDIVGDRKIRDAVWMRALTPSSHVQVGHQSIALHPLLSTHEITGLFRDLCGWAVFRSCAAPTRCCGIG